MYIAVFVLEEDENIFYKSSFKQKHINACGEKMWINL